jgi:seryl-tRNA synthetase
MIFKNNIYIIKKIKSMKHLKTFESFTINNSEQINEELFGGKLKKAKDKFINDNKDLFNNLKKAEESLDKKDEESQKALANIQKELSSKLRTFTKAGGELMSLLGISKVDADYNTISKELSDKITNVQAFDDRSFWQKFISGSSSDMAHKR